MSVCVCVSVSSTCTHASVCLASSAYCLFYWIVIVSVSVCACVSDFFFLFCIIILYLFLLCHFYVALEQRQRQEYWYFGSCLLFCFTYYFVSPISIDISFQCNFTCFSSFSPPSTSSFLNFDSCIDTWQPDTQQTWCSLPTDWCTYFFSCFILMAQNSQKPVLHSHTRAVSIFPINDSNRILLFSSFFTSLVKFGVFVWDLSLNHFTCSTRIHFACIFD